VSKSRFSGIGVFLPMALVLESGPGSRPLGDSGEDHSRGTFRWASNLRIRWDTERPPLVELLGETGVAGGQVRRHAELISKRLEAIAATGGTPTTSSVVAGGLMQWGLGLRRRRRRAWNAYRKAAPLPGLVAETCGGH